jgi:hypothetical protein
LEAFATGTAVVISPINRIFFEGNNYKIPIIEEIGAGKLSNELFNELLDI